MFKKGTLTIWFDSGDVQLVLYRKDREQKLLYSGSVDRLLRGSVLEEYKSRIDNVAIVFPDDWISRSFFPFRSPKKKYIKPFILRQIKKLTDQDDQLAHYHYYFLFDKSDEEKGLYVYYLTRKDCLPAIRHIDSLGFNISLITTPGLLWGEKLKGLFKKKGIENAALLIHSDDRSYLFMYHRKSFVFSRGFDFSDYSQEEDAFQSLIFETNQSFIYFTQRYKSEVELLALIDTTSSEEFVTRLEENVGKDIFLINTVSARQCSDSSDHDLTNSNFQHWKYFCERDFLNATNVPNLLPENELKNICYSCFERAGVVVGTVLLLIFMLQAGWMQFQYRSLLKHMEAVTTPIESDMNSTLNKWSDAANAIIEKATQPSISNLLSEIGSIDIPFLQLNLLEVDLYSNRGLKVSGILKTEDTRAFRKGIELLMNKLATIMPPGTKIGWDDVTFQRDFQDGKKMCFRFEIRTEI